MQLIKVIVLLFAQYDFSVGDQLSFHSALQKIVSSHPKHDLLSTSNPTIKRTVFCASRDEGLAHINLHDELGRKTRTVLVNDVNVLNRCSDLILMDDGDGHSVEEANRITIVNVAFVAASSRHDNVVYGLDIGDVKGLKLLAFDKSKTFQVEEFRVNHQTNMRRGRTPISAVATGPCLNNKSSLCFYLAKRVMLRQNKISWFEEPSLKKEQLVAKFSKADLKNSGSSFSSMVITKDGYFYMMWKHSPKIEVFEYRNKYLELTKKFFLPNVMSYLGLLRKDTERNVLLAEDTQLYLLSSSLLVDGKTTIDESDIRLKLPAKEDYIFTFVNRKGLIMFVSKKYPFKVGIMNI